MLQTIYKNWLPRGQHRRKRVLNKIRGQIERNGYSLEGIADSDLEAAITYDCRPIERAIPMTGKRIFWSLRRLFADGNNFAGKNRNFEDARVGRGNERVKRRLFYGFKCNHRSCCFSVPIFRSSYLVGDSLAENATEESIRGYTRLGRRRQ